ncbi:hypothetical protein RIF29_37993 [Crotalaria pallida]|uniref:Lecithin:cholesterol acyltransferase n=1 Tax=Crotalaria pallida TaxID=3830 RepID=A0AAN9E1E5_CROPI
MRSCPCFGDRDSDEAEADLDPVVLISGMGGSVMNSKPKKFGFKTRVWVRFFLADLEFRTKVLSLYNPKTGYTEILDKNSVIEVPDDDHGLYAIDILDPSPFIKCIHLTEVYHFHDMIDMLVGCGYKKGTTLFGYGYDFRQSNRIEQLMEGLKVKLETAYKKSGGRKVNLISHSMGGILILCFMSLHNDLFSKYVKKWICMACPFQGAPGCVNDALLTGLQFVYGFESYFFVSRWSMHQLLVECPSIYEMLPNPEYKWKKQPEIQVWRKLTKNGEININLESYGTTQSYSLFEEALRKNEVNYNGKKIALPFNTDILQWAAGTRQLIRNSKLPDGVQFYNIYGTSFDTPFDVCYGSEKSPIEDMSEICHTLPEYTYVDGDGTVPAESCKADGLEAIERVEVAVTHREILRDQKVFRYIQKWLGIEKPTVSKQNKTSKVADSDPIKPMVL